MDTLTAMQIKHINAPATKIQTAHFGRFFQFFPVKYHVKPGVGNACKVNGGKSW